MLPQALFQVYRATCVIAAIGALEDVYVGHRLSVAVGVTWMGSVDVGVGFDKTSA